MKRRMAGALHRMFDSDTDEEEFFGFEIDNVRETGRVADKAIPRLFESDTAEEDFGGFRTHDKDKDEDE